MKRKFLKRLRGGSESSVVNLIEICGQKLVQKKAPRINVERHFHRTLSQNGLPSLRMFPEYEENTSEIIFEYIDDSVNLWEQRTVENYKTLGEVVSKMHEIIYYDFAYTDDSGSEVVSSWLEQLELYMQESIKDFVDTNANITHDFNDEEVNLIVEIVKKLSEQTPEKFSLIHGDLHSGNVLIKEGELVMYDKDERFLMAPLEFDLSMILSEIFNSSFFVKKSDEIYKRDRKHLYAFINGYGKKVIDEKMDLIKRYALLRALKRYPHPFMDYQVEMMKCILKSYTN